MEALISKTEDLPDTVTQKVHWDLIYALLISLLLHIIVIGYGLLMPRIVGNISSVMPAETRLNATLNARNESVTPEIIEEIPATLVDEETNPQVLSTEKPSETSFPTQEAEEVKPKTPPEMEQKPKETTLAPLQTDQPQSQQVPGLTAEGDNTHDGTVQIYHSTADLTVAPRMIGEPNIHLPVPIGGGEPPMGRLVLKIAVSSLGLVDWIEVEKSTLPPVFGAAISEAFRSVRYSPGEIDGKKAASLLFMEVMIDDGQKPVQLLSPAAQEKAAKETLIKSGLPEK